MLFESDFKAHFGHPLDTFFRAEFGNIISAGVMNYLHKIRQRKKTVMHLVFHIFLHEYCDLVSIYKYVQIKNSWPCFLCQMEMNEIQENVSDCVAIGHNSVDPFTVYILIINIVLVLFLREFQLEKNIHNICFCNHILHFQIYNSLFNRQFCVTQFS